MQFKRPMVPTAFTIRVNAIHAGTAKHREIWRDYKSDFLRAQHERCGYCDSRLDKSSHHDIDHYQPKGRLDEIDDPDAEFKCRNEIPPKVRNVATIGYDWLTYAWTNYVYVCKGCNQTFKRCLFPVKDGTRTLPLDRSITTNEASWLLLWCYGKEDPAGHLEFTPVGTIAAKNDSAHGLATILTCGLSRRSLQDLRAEKLESATETIKRLEEARAANDAQDFADCIEKLRCVGAANRNFAGVFRIFVMQELGAKTWDQVLALQL